MSNASSEYTDAKSTRPESTVYYTAPESNISVPEGSPSIDSRSKSNGNATSAAIDEHWFPTGSPRSIDGTPSEATPKHRSPTPSTRSIRSLERLRDEGQLDPKPTGPENPLSSSFSQTLEYALTSHNIEDVEAEEIALPGLGLTTVEEAQRHNRVQSKNKHRVPIHQYREGMDLLVSKIWHERYRVGNCSRKQWRLASDPPKIISETDLCSETEQTNASPPHTNHFPEYVEGSRLEISPHAPRSAALAKRVKQQDAPPQTNAKKNFYVRRSLCVTMIGAPKVGGLEWRLCTYEELTWMEMMDQLNEERIEEGFQNQFGWKMPKDWVVLANEMHKDPLFFKRKYLGWTPDAVSWKLKVGSVGSSFEDLATTRVSHEEQLSL